MVCASWTLINQTHHSQGYSELPIFIGSEGYIDTSAHEPDSQFDTALRVLEVCHI